MRFMKKIGGELAIKHASKIKSDPVSSVLVCMMPMPMVSGRSIHAGYVGHSNYS